ncbi:hypothetical protein [Bacillus cereus]|uniref:hypothetical protein n=1 Tax=Bacillus cereus group TaxID=86661 RepID=UPI001C8ECB75|nr:hypothetical protein [Bacillus cereus]MBY0015080.1 hypothetical protein [Bacillus cereus]MDZ4502725.1 hypothetical protein [Bacillus cereus]
MRTESDIYTCNNATAVVVDGVKFELKHWSFNVDGVYGHLYFNVPKDVYEHSSNNGAYVESSSDPEEDCDIAYAATPCCLPNDISDYSFKDIVKECVSWINLNISRKKPSFSINGKLEGNLPEEVIETEFTSWVNEKGFKFKKDK